MNNEERKNFLKQKPNYCCRFHPTDWFHEVGCADREWTVEELQSALDSCKRSEELRIYLLNHPD